MSVPFDEWIIACGFIFYHCTDRYGHYGHGHVFVCSCDEDMQELVMGLEGDDNDSFDTTHKITALVEEEKCFIGYDKDPVEAVRKCVDSMKAFKVRLDERMDKGDW